MKNYFKKSETSCRCGCGLDVAPEMLYVINKIRAEYGKPISLNCGARCPTHNEKVGGSPKSAHMSGQAVDMKRNEELLACIKNNLEKLDIYIEDPVSTPTWIHVQTRKTFSGKRTFKP